MRSGSSSAAVIGVRVWYRYTEGKVHTHLGKTSLWVFRKRGVWPCEAQCVVNKMILCFSCLVEFSIWPFYGMDLWEVWERPSSELLNWFFLAICWGPSWVRVLWAFFLPVLPTRIHGTLNFILFPDLAGDLLRWILLIRSNWALWFHYRIKSLIQESLASSSLTTKYQNKYFPLYIVLASTRSNLTSKACWHLIVIKKRGRSLTWIFR